MASGRTALVIYAVLLVVIAFQRFGLGRGLGVVSAGALLGLGAFAVSPYLQMRVLSAIEEVQKILAKDEKMFFLKFTLADSYRKLATTLRELDEPELAAKAEAMEKQYRPAPFKGPFGGPGR